MKVSQRGLALIKQHEGCELQAYRCPAGIWTIGYGHTSEAGDPAVKRGMKITQAEAEQILARDLGRYEKAVENAIDPLLMTQNQFDAMVSLCYNIGPGAFSKSSVARYFNAGNVPMAAKSFTLWNKAGGKVLPGLVSRREAERRLFMEPRLPEPFPTPAPPPTAPTPPAPSYKPTAGQAAGLIGFLMAAVAAFMAWMGWK